MTRPMPIYASALSRRDLFRRRLARRRRLLRPVVGLGSVSVLAAALAERLAS
jgi:hypothetical protein